MLEKYDAPVKGDAEMHLPEKRKKNQKTLDMYPSV